MMHFFLCILMVSLFGADAQAQSSSALLPVNTAALTEYRANPKSIEGNYEKAYAVNEAILSQYYNDLISYYMEKYKTTEPIANRDIVDLYLSYARELPTPILVDMARGSTLLSAFTILFLAKVAAVEYQQGRVVSVVTPPPYIVNTDISTSDGKVVPVPVATAVKEDRRLYIEKHVNGRLLANYSDRIKSFERSQKFFKFGVWLFGFMAIGGAAFGVLGLQAQLARDRRKNKV